MAPLSPAEEDRLAEVADYQLVDTPDEAEFDHIVALTASLFDVPISLISIIDRDRQYFKARVGMTVCSTDRDISFCTHAIRDNAPLIVEDARRDPRFADNSLVTGPPHIRFYAGAPLLTQAGHALGTLCIIDSKPRSFDPVQAERLQAMAQIVMDRIELRRTELTLRATHQRLRNVCDASSSALVSTDSGGRIIFFNRSAEMMFGYSQDEAIGLSIDHLIPSGEWPCAPVNGFVEMTGRRRGGARFPASVARSPWMEGESQRLGYVINDITERRRVLDRLEQAAHVDHLTGLPNRLFFTDQATELLAGKGQVPAALLLIDLDGFKDINDVLGYAAGDRLLVSVARRLQSCLDDSVALARFGGDEFVVLAPGVGDPREAYALARRLCEAVCQPFTVDGHELRLAFGIGVAVAPYHGNGIEQLLSNADLALGGARSGGNPIQFFEPHLRHRAEARQTMQGDLHRALDEDQFEILFQPQIDLRDRRVTGAEVLLRWRHPEHGLLPPGLFLSVLDHMALSGPVGNWVLRAAIRQGAAWRAEGKPPVRIGVNLFGAQLFSNALPDFLEAELHAAGLPARWLEVEVTETIALKGNAAVNETLNAIHAMGVGIALDDFGTGHASLSLLKELPVTRLKIDQSFVRDVADDPCDAAVIDAILALGESFGLEVIAEGIETPGQEELLVAAGCAQGQGYLYGRPMPGPDFTRLLEAAGGRRDRYG